MRKGRPQTEFELEDGRYVFDSESMHEIYKYAQGKGRKHMIPKLAEELNCAESTIKGWMRGAHGPSDIRMVEGIAEYFGRDVRDFLTQIERKDTKMNSMNISDSERMIARNLYGEMLEMMQLLDWTEPDPDDIMPRVRAENSGCFHNQEEARKHYLLAIRKTALDLPAQMRKELSDFVRDCFGPDYDVDYNEMYFNAEEYKTYLEDNGWKDNIDARYKYAATFMVDMSGRLDEIFADYIRI